MLFRIYHLHSAISFIFFNWNRIFFFFWKNIELRSLIQVFCTCQCHFHLKQKPITLRDMKSWELLALWKYNLTVNLCHLSLIRKKRFYRKEFFYWHRSDNLRRCRVNRKSSYPSLNLFVMFQFPNGLFDWVDNLLMAYQMFVYLHLWNSFINFWDFFSTQFSTPLSLLWTDRYKTEGTLCTTYLSVNLH